MVFVRAYLNQFLGIVSLWRGQTMSQMLLLAGRKNNEFYLKERKLRVRFN